MNKENIKTFMGIIIVIFLTTVVLSFMNSAFIPASLFILSLNIFTVCYYIKDKRQKSILYILYSIGILIVLGALVYTIMRLI